MAARKPDTKPDALHSTTSRTGQVMDNAGLRVEWVDIAKAISIALVVMMHSTLGVELAVDSKSWMGQIVEFARPFRIPCFMAVSGLFLHRTINGPWRKYADSKVLHFVYFYVLWVTIQCAVKTPAWQAQGMDITEIFQQYLTAFVQPFGTLWFIYLLPIFYLVTRALRNVPQIWLIAGAALLNIAPIHTGSVIIDEFASRYVFFAIGYVFSANLFAWAQYAHKNKGVIFGLVMVWFVANTSLVFNSLPEFLGQWFNAKASFTPKYADLPIVALVLGMMGTLMIMACASIIQTLRVSSLFTYLGRNSIIIYLAFFLPMGVVRILTLKFGWPHLSTGTIAFMVTLAAFIGPLVLHAFVQRFNIGKFLFERPNWAKLTQNGEKQAPAPAE